MIAVLKHELFSYFRTLTPYVFGAFLLVFIGVGAMIFNIQEAVSNFEYVLSFVSIVFVIIVPLLTMRTIAEEKKQKTDQLLYSLPLNTTEIVIGKYLALLIVYLIPVCLICTYPLVFAQFGEVYLLTSYGAILAFFIMGAAMLAVGMFLSSLTENQGFAAGTGVAVILLNYYSVTLAEQVSSTGLGSVAALCVLFILIGAAARYITGNDDVAYVVTIVPMAVTSVCYFFNSDWFEGLLPQILSGISLFERFYVFVDGVFDLSAIVYYLSVIGFFLFLTVQSLEKRRYN